MEKTFLEEIKELIEESRKARVSRETIDKCFRIYHENISRDDITNEEKVYLCIMNGLAYVKLGSYLPADSSYLLARRYANESKDEKLLLLVGYEIIYFYANSKEWVMENRSDSLRRFSEF